MTCVMIATPTPGMVRAGYVATIADTVAALLGKGIGAVYSGRYGGDLIVQRNMLATLFLSEPKFTHLFFVDSDMGFDGRLALRLLEHDKPLIGAVYQSKGEEDSSWLAFLSERTEVTNGDGKCDAIPLGAAMIRRDVLETMIAKGAKFQTAGKWQFYNFFGARAEDAARGDHVSEDHSFCRRWRALGGEVWALLDFKIAHIGDHNFGGRETYIDYLKKNGAFTPQATNEGGSQ